MNLTQRESRAYIFLNSLVICGLAVSLMTPVIYLLVQGINHYLDNNTLAFSALQA